MRSMIVGAGVLTVSLGVGSAIDYWMLQRKVDAAVAERKDCIRPWYAQSHDLSAEPDALDTPAEDQRKNWGKFEPNPLKRFPPPACPPTDEMEKRYPFGEKEGLTAEQRQQRLTGESELKVGGVPYPASVIITFLEPGDYMLAIADERVKKAEEAKTDRDPSTYTFTIAALVADVAVGGAFVALRNKQP